MMTRRVTMKHKRMEAADWVFAWRNTRGRQWRFLASLAITGVAYALMLSSVRIRVPLAAPWSGEKASVIRVLEDADGRALTLRAREGGPFPSRFDPVEWERAGETSRSVWLATSWLHDAHTPMLRDLRPKPQSALTPWVPPRGPVLPERRAAATPPRSVIPGRPKPQLYPLAATDAAALPRALPAFDAVVDPSMAAEPWRCLLHVSASGEVLDCFPLASGDAAGSSALDRWLRRVSFPPDPARQSRWIAVGVGFTHALSDGTDSH